MGITVWSCEISSTGDLSFNASSEQTYAPVLKDSDVGAGDSDALTKSFEVVRSWTATKNGTVNISGIARYSTPFWREKLRWPFKKRVIIYSLMGRPPRTPRGC